MAVHIAIAGMDVELADRVLETTQTSGTGAYSLDGVSVPGKRSFVDGVGSGNRTIYVVEDSGSSWEIGIGTVTAGAPSVITRDYILRTSAGAGPGGSPLNWPTTVVKAIYIGTAADLLLQIIDPARVLDLETRAALKDVQNVFTAQQIIDRGANNVVSFIVRNLADVGVFQIRITTNGNGALRLFDNAGDMKFDLLAGVARGEFHMNGFQVYPLGEGLAATQATTSGTTKDFTIRSDAERITVMLNGVSTNGTNNILVRLGDSGGIETTGYDSVVGSMSSAGSGATDAVTDGFPVARAIVAARSYRGRLVLDRMAGNLWQAGGTSHDSSAVAYTMSGTKELSDVITTVRLTSAGTPDTFDGGSVTVRVE